MENTSEAHAPVDDSSEDVDTRDAIRTRVVDSNEQNRRTLWGVLELPGPSLYQLEHSSPAGWVLGSSRSGKGKSSSSVAASAW